MEELVKMIEEMGIPFAYDHFAEGESPDPPFICYLLPDDENFAADGKVYYRTNEDEIEVQTETLSLKATPLANGFVKAKTGDDTTDAVYQDWYKAVYMTSTTTNTESGVES